MQGGGRTIRIKLDILVGYMAGVLKQGQVESQAHHQSFS